MPKKSIETAETLIQASIIGFAAALPVSIAFFHLALGAGWAAFLAKGRLSGKWPGFRTGMDPYFGLFFLACLVSSITSIKPGESFISLKEFFNLSAVYLVAYNTHSFERIREIIGAFLLTAALSGAYGVAAVAYGMGVEGRLVGALGMAMTSGSVYMMASLVGLAYWRYFWNRTAGWRRWLAPAAFFIITLSLALTRTVNSWLGWAAGLACSVRVWRRWVKYAVLAAAVLLLATAFMQPRIVREIYKSKQSTWQARLTIWKIGWQIIKEHPITGTGLIDLGEIYQSKRTAEDLARFGNRRRYGHLHNNFIHITAITGVAGLAAFLAMFWGIISLNLRNISGGGEMTPFYLAFLAAATAFLVGGLAEWSYGDTEVVTVLWLFTGLALAAERLGARLPVQPAP